MKTLLTLTLVVLMAGSAFAQLDNSMGMFFGDELTEANTNMDTSAAPFNAYVAILNCTQFSIAAYEVEMDLGGAFVLEATGPNGWTNFGSNTNHLCGYQTPLPCPEGDVVLSTLSVLYSGTDTVNIFFGPSNPSSVGGEGPAIADGSDPTILVTCGYTTCPDDEALEGWVATFNGDGVDFCGVVATENQSWTELKALF